MVAVLGGVVWEREGGGGGVRNEWGRREPTHPPTDALMVWGLGGWFGEGEEEGERGGLVLGGRKSGLGGEREGGTDTPTHRRMNGLGVGREGRREGVGEVGESIAYELLPGE